MTRKWSDTVVLLLGLVLVAGVTFADTRSPLPVPERLRQPGDDLIKANHQQYEASVEPIDHHRLTLRFLVDSPLRPPSHALEWVDGSPDDVLCFEGTMHHPNQVHLTLGDAVGCAKIVAQHPLEEGGAILALKVRHIIQLSIGSIVDDDFAIVAPLLDAPTRVYSHGLSATTDMNNIRPELGTGFYQDKDGMVGVNGNLNLSQFPDQIQFNALFTIEFTD